MALLSSDDMSNILDKVFYEEIGKTQVRMKQLVSDLLEQIKTDKNKITFNVSEYTELAKSDLDQATKIRDNLKEFEEIEKIYTILLGKIQDGHIPYTYLSLLENLISTPFNKVITNYNICKDSTSEYVDHSVMWNLLEFSIKVEAS